jgi:hypothetical protein
VLKLSLHPTSYDWEFIPVAGDSPIDSELRQRQAERDLADDRVGDLSAWSASTTDNGDLSLGVAVAGGRGLHDHDDNLFSSTIYCPWRATVSISVL